MSRFLAIGNHSPLGKRRNKKAPVSDTGIVSKTGAKCFPKPRRASYVFLRKFLRFSNGRFFYGQRNGERDGIVPALAGERAAVKLRDLPGNGKAQPRAAGRGARRVQPVELLKNARELFRRDRVAAIPEADNGEIADALRRDGDLRARVAVEHGVAQKVIKDALQFVRVAPNGERLGCGERAGEVFLSQHRLKLKRKLLEQAGEVGGTVLQLDGGEIEESRC